MENIDKDHSVKDGIELKIWASALNHRDVWITKGKYPGVKSGVVLGSDGVGMYNGSLVMINPGMEWGESEAAQSRGFNILGMPFNGTFGEYCVVPSDHIHAVPAHLSIHEAAALPLAGVTAYRALMVKGETTGESRVFINGLGGGVAVMVSQMALAMGCKVYGTTGSEWKMEKAEKTGVEKAYNYKDNSWPADFISDFGGADVIIDSAGGPAFANLLKIANPGAKIITYGGTNGKITELSPQIIFWKQISIMGTTMGSNLDFKNMVKFLAKFEVHPIIDEVIPLRDAVAGFEKMEKGRQFGKIVFSHDD